MSQFVLLYSLRGDARQVGGTGRCVVDSNLIAVSCLPQREQVARHAREMGLEAGFRVNERLALRGAVCGLLDFIHHDQAVG